MDGLGVVLGVGPVLERSWVVLRQSWADLFALGAALERSWSILGGLGVVLELLGAILEPLGLWREASWEDPLGPIET